jgi:cellulose synthase/poly-beta-1,6-N-acetylglucosamine synthase-like glycosyltransferase
MLGLVWAGLILYSMYLQRAIDAIPQLQPLLIDHGENERAEGFPSVTVIIPAYNEAENIEACVLSVLGSIRLGADRLAVWVVDDQSTDNTLELLRNLATQSPDPRLQIWAGQPRPSDAQWRGKNWACAQVADRATSEFILFIDADVRLQPGAIAGAVQTAQAQSVDLLNCLPALVCGSLVEWLVQPLIFMNLLVSFNSTAVNNPKDATAFAAGPFMLFRRTAYEAVGGHRAVADQIAEDVSLARRIKHQELRLGYYLGADIATLRMYRTWGQLWEGWTKVLYVGAQRKALLMVLLAGMMMILFCLPGFSFAIFLVQILMSAWGSGAGGGGVNLGCVAIALLCLGWHYRLRVQIAQALNSTSKYWWLQSLGGGLVALLAIASVIKTETGWGWTWRGRSLK